jgi:release factor glutamine methyltransferase
MTRSAAGSTSSQVAEAAAATTTGGLIAEATRRLASTSAPASASVSASASPRLDAEVLLAFVLGVERARLVLDRDVSVGARECARFEALVARRAVGEPVAYLIGRRGFRWLELEVDARVLIPRPETELLVEVAVGLAAGASVLDVGTGSGAIALAVASERPDLVVRGVDVSADAVAVARANAARLGLERVSFSVGDLLSGAERSDAVLANLPYVEEDAELPADVADHEPALALFGGADGLSVIRLLVSMVAGDWPSLLALEIGETQGSAVSGLVRAAGFDEVSVLRDLAGRDRVVVGRRSRMTHAADIQPRLDAEGRRSA